jgi:hypothetical protein
MGIGGIEFDWFRDYLSNRKQFNFLYGKSSSLLDILIGVPQGSILGPLLFLSSAFMYGTLVNFVCG